LGGFVIRFEWVTGTRNFAQLRPVWEKLAAENPASAPFGCFYWNDLWCTTAHASAAAFDPACLLSQEDGQLAGILPLAIKRRGPFRRLEWLGREVSDFPDLMLAAGSDPEAAMGAIRQALNKAPADYIHLDYIGPESHVRQVLAVEPADACQQIAMIALDDAEAGYEAALSSRVLKVLRRGPRKITTELGPFHFETAHTAEERRAVVRFIIDHKTRALGQTADGRIYAQTIAPFVEQCFAREGDFFGTRLHVTSLRLGGRILAAHTGFFNDREFYYYHAGYDGEMQRYSPGALLLDHLIRGAIKFGLRHFNFMRGDESYKNDWTSTVRPSFQYLRPVGISGRMALAARDLSQRWRLPMPGTGAPLKA